MTTSVSLRLNTV